ncbi:MULTISPECIES: methylenetetrahydrofolate reductase [Desulfofundulus]|uniref:Methylenetetrahydrofolate reductase n=1 Tax=Desulfofundulus australicus DSM 11792 TaxID=1121425 RepID=A0A1M5BV23_9FIRM|nr:MULTISPECIES: methylenetetrahydrofolate reductase [Desulfofundulus]MCS5695813.1 methylenetetrahydrofolate reductase [Desulfofundulus thermocisternus]SHF46082.1 5,10-methylenetetrahydrofolate reductase (ferredoxin) [Desulfofundulus australicus DSM 11792]
MKTESKLQKLLDSGHFAVTAEIGPPKHASAHGIRHHAQMLKDYVDATNITDCQTAIVRLSSIASAVHILDCGLEPIVQMTCRDRNRIAIQSDLLGAYSLGVRNLLCLSGDHQKFGNEPSAKNVYDIDSIQLIYLMRRMRDEKLFFSGEPIKEHEPRFFIGAVANPFADPFEFRVARLEKKVEAGAEFIQTQCIFDMERFERFMEMVRERGIHERVHILAGVTPLKSWRAAKYLQTSVSGMIVPDDIVERLKKADDPKREGIEICIEQIKHIRTIPGVHGVHIMAIAWEEVVPEIVERSGLYPRPKVE